MFIRSVLRLVVFKEFLYWIDGEYIYIIIDRVFLVVFFNKCKDLKELIFWLVLF